jgi:uracil-DNA glycosylase family 4
VGIDRTANVLPLAVRDVGVENVTDRTSNPFDMAPPCSHRSPEGVGAVYGYGDANADFHVVGDHPGVHGGGTTGVPFTDSEAGDRLLAVLDDVGLVDREPDGRYEATNAFCSYLHCCWPAPDGPSADDYADLERFFDAELRAIAAHVLVPVGDRAVEHVLAEYTNQAGRVGTDARDLHASEIRGRGFKVVPVAEPGSWGDGDAGALRDRLAAVLASDYAQMSDLGRFQPDADPYFVR